MTLCRPQYINLLEPRRVRARQLADSKFFACGCARCSSPLAASTDRFLEAKSSKAMYVHELLMCNPYVQNMRSARVILARCARKQSVMTDAQLCCPASEQGVQCDKAGCGGVLLAPQPPADGGGNAAASAAAAAAAGVSEQWTCCECGRQKVSIHDCAGHRCYLISVHQHIACFEPQRLESCQADHAQCPPQPGSPRLRQDAYLLMSM